MAAVQQRKQLTGVVVSAGRMIKTVKVRIAKQKWNKLIQKNYAAPITLMASDPTQSVREGDVVVVEGGRRVSRNVRHTIAGIIAPMGPPLSERPAIPTSAERWATVEAKREAKDVRQAARGRWPAIKRMEERRVKAEEMGREMGRVKVGEEGRQEAKEKARGDDLPNQEAPLRKLVKLRREGALRISLAELINKEKVLQGQSEPTLEYLQQQAREVTKRLEKSLSHLQEECANITEKESAAKWMELQSAIRAQQSQIRTTEERNSRITHYLNSMKGQSTEFRASPSTAPLQWLSFVYDTGLQPSERRAAALSFFGKEAFGVLFRPKIINEIAKRKKALKPVDDATNPVETVKAQNFQPKDSLPKLPSLDSPLTSEPVKKAPQASERRSKPRVEKHVRGEGEAREEEVQELQRKTIPETRKLEREATSETNEPLSNETKTEVEEEQKPQRSRGVLDWFKR